MRTGIDSSSAKPTPELVQQFKSAGYSLWSGYISTTGRSGDFNISAPWTQSDFDLARQLGGIPIAYCSGHDDPAACAELAGEWNVRLCLDVETSIRGDGDWVQGWLDASNAGLYGNYTVHRGRTAAFHVMSGYPGHDPGVPWPTDQPRPVAPCAWQWAGSVTQFGISVDLMNADDWFVQQQEDGDLTSAEFDQVKQWLETDREQWVGIGITLGMAMAGITSSDPRFQQVAKEVQRLVSSGEKNSVDAIQAMLGAGGPPVNMLEVVTKMGQQHGA